MRIVFQFVFTVIIAWAAGMQANAQSATPRSLKIAALLSLTGDASVHADNIRKGIELAAEELREHGWTIDIRYEDDQTNSAKTVSAMQLLMGQGYKLFIGPTWDSQAHSLRGTLSKREIVMLAPALTSALVGGPINEIFNLSSQRNQEFITPLANLLRQDNLSKAFIFTPNGPWGEHHRTIFRKAIEEAGGQVVGDEQFDYGIDAATSRILIMKAKRADADVILETGASSDVANLVRARNALGLKHKIFGTEDLIDALNLQLVTKDDLKGTAFAIKIRVAANFVNKYQIKYGKAPGVYADRGYDALMLLAEAAQKTDGSAKAIRDLFRSGAEFNSSIQPIRFNKNGDIEGGGFDIIDLSK